MSWKFDAGSDVIYKYTTFSNSSVLKLRKLRERDTGYYTCVAYNRAGHVEKRAYVKVMCEYSQVFYYQLKYCLSVLRNVSSLGANILHILKPASPVWASDGNRCGRVNLNSHPSS